MIKEENITVIRGKFGATKSVSVWDIVVGDVILLESGSNVPADCIVLDAYDCRVTEMQENGEEKIVKKTETGDSLLFSGSNIINGRVKALVCVVGPKSTGFHTFEKLDTDKDTTLQKKLKNLSDTFTFYAIVGALVIFGAMMVRLIIELAAIEEGAPKSVGAVLVSRITGHINLVVVLIVVSIPEGLPLTIGVSLAFTVMKMYSEKILVRKLDAPEEMGRVSEILLGKTGCITKNEMKVMQFNVEGKKILNTRNDTLLNCNLKPETLMRIKESILYNCAARVEMGKALYTPVGSGTEVGLLKFLQDADIPIHLLIQKKLGKIKMIIPFTSERKYSVTAIENPDR